MSTTTNQMGTTKFAGPGFKSVAPAPVHDISMERGTVPKIPKEDHQITAAVSVAGTS